MNTTFWMHGSAGAVMYKRLSQDPGTAYLQAIELWEENPYGSVVTKDEKGNAIATAMGRGEDYRARFISELDGWKTMMQTPDLPAAQAAAQSNADQIRRIAYYASEFQRVSRFFDDQLDRCAALRKQLQVGDAEVHFTIRGEIHPLPAPLLKELESLVQPFVPDMLRTMEFDLERKKRKYQTRSQALNAMLDSLRITLEDADEVAHAISVSDTDAILNDFDLANTDFQPYQ